MQILALIEAIAAGLTPANVQQYITLLENIIAVADKIEAAVENPSQQPTQNGSANG